MKNEFGIEVLSTTEPPRRMNYEDWARKFNVGILYQKKDYESILIMHDYNFNKLNNSHKKNFVDKLKHFIFD